jgi:glycosyltransferase involved in cell wall biosynthesis
MKKVLFISYFWPPSGKASLHWPLFILKHLSRLGWDPFILTIDEDTFSHKDDSLLKEIDPKWKIIKTAANEPFALYRRLLGKKSNSPLVASETISRTNQSMRHKLAVWIRMNLFVPDARIGWYFSAVRGGKTLLNNTPVDAIVSIGPPHSSHLIGKRLSRLYSIPYVPVFIDPWVDIAYYRDFKRSAPTLALDGYFEKSVLNDAAKVIFVTKSMQEEYHKKYPWLAQKSQVLYWGYNEESFEHVSVEKEGREERIILHAGNIFDYQNPLGLWANIADEIHSGAKLRLRFVGTVSPGVKTAIADAGLTQFTDYVGFLPYPKVIEEMMNASFLLVCATEKRHVPGKLFEYLRAGKPIIAFGDDNIEVETILQETNAGVLFPYSSQREDMFSKLSLIRPDISKAKQYSREKIAIQLAQMLDILCARD